MSEVSSPFPPEWTVRRARDAYLAENGFTAEGYDAKWTEGSVLGVRLWVPNTKRHRWAIMLHDLHHVATGYGTDLVGEGEISAWELRHSVWALGPYVATIVLFGALAGAVVAPRRTLAAWQSAESAGSLHASHLVTDEVAYAKLLDMTVGELRERLHVPVEGVWTGPRKLHDYAPVQVSA